MSKIIHKTNIWILFFFTLLLALFIASNPGFALDGEDAAAFEPRNAFAVSYSAAEESVIQALTMKGVGDKISAAINGRTSKPIFAYNKPVTVEVRGLTYDKRLGYWEASLAFTADGTVISAIPASGHFDEMIEVAVLKHEMRANNIISESDIEIRDFSERQIRPGTVTDFASLIGKSPVRIISPFRPIRSAEVINPAIVKKDAIVQMQYRMPGMEISTSGQALMAGAKGDVITVRNLASKKTITAIIQDSTTVTILPAGERYAQNQ